MKYSVVKYKDTFSRFDARIDAEFFLPRYIAADSLIRKKKYSILENKAIKITDGTHYTPEYTEEGIPFLSAVNIKENHLDVDCGYKFISEEEHSSLYKRCNAKSQDVILRKVGVGPRHATVVPKNIFEFSLFVSVALIKTEEFNPYYLSTFINSLYGQTQLLRFNKGISQPDLHLEDIGKLEIPAVQEYFQKLIEKLCTKSETSLIVSKALYKQAEELLLKELGLLNWQPKHQLSYIKNYSETQEAGRFDAEYFQPKYDEIISKIKKQKYCFLKDVLSKYSTGFPYKSELYQEKGIPVVRITNIEKNKINLENTPVFISEDYSIVSPKDIASVGDILISMSGTIGSCAMIPKGIQKCCVNQRIFAFTPKDIKPLYLVFVLNSIPCSLQFEKIGVGGVQTNISPNDILEIQIPILNCQNEVQDLILELQKNENQSKQLLDIAKLGVEKAIEEDEQSATIWINKELKKIGVSL